MTTLCVRGRLTQSALHWLLLNWLLAGLFITAIASKAVAHEPADELIVVRADQATIIKLPERATTVVIGNPLIADLSIQSGGIAVVTGKSYGETNVVVMDRGGAVLSEKTVLVKAAEGPLVVVYRGNTKQTYSCTPDCEPRITLGDTSKADFDQASGLPTDYFNSTLSQSVNRSNQAMAAGGAH
jgi:Pilus formation protein N terminal region